MLLVDGGGRAVVGDLDDEALALLRGRVELRGGAAPGLLLGTADPAVAVGDGLAGEEEGALLLRRVVGDRVLAGGEVVRDALPVDLLRLVRLGAPAGRVVLGDLGGDALLERDGGGEALAGGGFELGGGAARGGLAAVPADLLGPRCRSSYS
ncbi:hypothetical protein [Streptomyces sp. SPB074]|uniref:hypothetical protein n=1 Tax=Streptomyces sp. (strain SPB074) TaxID=465543 RepID=UPI0018F89E33|nr:hypothetical protein [Streptomyces sp. SPB074]